MMAFLVLVALYRMSQYAHVLAQRCLGRNGSIGQREHHSPFRGANGIRITVVVSAVFVATTLRGSRLSIAATLGTGLVVRYGQFRFRCAEIIHTCLRRSAGNRSGKVPHIIGNRVYLITKSLRYLSLKNPYSGHGTGAYHSEICRFVDIPEGYHGWDSFGILTTDFSVLRCRAWSTRIGGLSFQCWQAWFSWHVRTEKQRSQGSVDRVGSAACSRQHDQFPAVECERKSLFRVHDGTTRGQGHFAQAIST